MLIYLTKLKKKLLVNTDKDKNSLTKTKTYFVSYFKLFVKLLESLILKNDKNLNGAQNIKMYSGRNLHDNSILRDE